MKNEILTFKEKKIVGRILERAQRSLKLDKESGFYEADSNFYLMLDIYEMETLTRAMAKI